MTIWTQSQLDIYLARRHPPTDTPAPTKSSRARRKTTIPIATEDQVQLAIVDRLRWSVRPGITRPAAGVMKLQARASSSWAPVLGCPTSCL